MIQPLPIWGGVECTVNGTEDAYQDQLIRTGHDRRLSDLNLVAHLGIDTIRYPVLWERVCPQSLDAPDWTWTDERLQRLLELDIDPVVGLVHHGCGPAYSRFDTPAFAQDLAQYAGMVAQRYPWVTHFTPVNEPLTTARFSGLYGVWYPHGRTDTVLVRLLLNQVQATIMAMRAIRKHTPHAKLVQTDDLGYTHCSVQHQQQAAFENHRRWLTWDLLCGYVTTEHPLYGYLLCNGISAVELEDIAAYPCAPDIIGVNHYVTSERYLGPEFQTEIVRHDASMRLGLAALLRQTWERYQIPVAVTEAHIGCTQDEQVRWLHEQYVACQAAKESGVDVVALTVWALFGLVDWHCLLGCQDHKYEAGVYDCSSRVPQSTALVQYVKYLTQNQAFDSSVLHTQGWWQ